MSGRPVPVQGCTGIFQSPAAIEKWSKAKITLFALRSEKR
jgi:hypothetical protein